MSETPETMKAYVMQYVDKLSQEGREAVYYAMRPHVSADDINSSNTDGSRIYTSKIPEAAWAAMYAVVKKYTEIVAPQ